MQEAAGKAAEHCLRAVQHLAAQPVIGLTAEIRNFEGECTKLANLSKSTAPDSVRLVIPRTLLALYTLRNKRSGGHTAAEVSPSLMDAAVAEHMADWVVAELFRLGTNLPPDEAQATIAALLDRRIPAIYREGDYRRVMKTGLSPREELMILLYAEPSGATPSELTKWSRLPATSLRRHLTALDDDRLIRVDKSVRPNRVTLLPSGERVVEEAGWLDPGL